MPSYSHGVIELIIECSSHLKFKSGSTMRRQNCKKKYSINTRSSICDSKFECSVCSLIKLYDSVPAYCELDHLSERDFYSTLDFFKESVCDIKEKSKSVTSLVCSPCQTCWDKSTNTRISPVSRSPSEKKLSRSRSATPLQASSRTTDIRESRITYYKKPKEYVEKEQDIAPSKSSSPIKEHLAKEIRRIEDENVNTPKVQRSSNNTPNELKTSNKLNFSFLGSKLNTPKLRAKSFVALPIYPAARSNLAATLRAQVARKKRCDSACDTFQSKFNNIDWEVRKSPGWKSLRDKEPHKYDILCRVATRKAEQRLQAKEYHLHMELMRQRVKAAPLLLEGKAIYWDPAYTRHDCNNLATDNIKIINVKTNSVKENGKKRYKSEYNSKR